LQCRRLEAFDLNNNLAAARRPDTEMNAGVGLRLGADRQAPDGRRLGRGQMFRNGRLGRCRKRLSLVRDAEAGARVHAASSRSPYERLPWACGCVTTPAVILSSRSISDGTRSGCSNFVVDRTTPRMAVAICTRRAAYAWSFSKSLEAR
jgi:hypothetical protein